MPLPLLQSPPELFSVLAWSICLLLLAAALFAAIAWVRRKYVRSDESPGAGFTLADLRQLHKDGKMTDEEFERAKAQLVQTMQASASSKTEPPQHL